MSIRTASTIEADVKGAARCLAVAVAICSWIALSNHCAFGAIATKTATAQSECPFHSKPATPQKQSAGIQCCKILRAIPTSPTKNFSRAIVDLVHVDLAFAELIVFPPPEFSFDLVALDTGPPGTTSFAELIGSMRAHAPPSLA